MRTKGILFAILSTAAIALSATPANATTTQAPPPPEPVPASRCINEFSFNDNYVGEGWVGASVEYRDGGDWHLNCGDELSGVVHITHPESTGTVHPLPADGSQDRAFEDCFLLSTGFGTARPDPGFPETRTRYDYGYGNGNVATVIVDNAKRFTYTMFTSAGPAGNDWLGCASGAYKLTNDDH